MNAAPEKAVRALRVLSRVLCAAALTAPLAAAQPAEPAADVWLERAADEARTITGRGARLTAALSVKGQLLADAAGLAAARGGDQAPRWFTLSELCETALVHRQANGPVAAALVAGLVRAGRADEAAARAEALPAGPDREHAHAALAGALAMANPRDPRAAGLRSAADPSAAAAWAPAFAEAGDFDGLAALVGGADLPDGRRAALLAGLAEAQARSGRAAAAQQTLDQALALSPDLAQGNALALAGARAALGHLDAAADAVDALRAPADQVRGLSRLAAAQAAAGDQAAALSSLRSAAEAAGRSAADDGLSGAVRELARVAADAGQADQVGPWIDALGDPRVRAAAALGLAEGLSAPALRPRMTRALTRPSNAAEPVAAAEPARLSGPDATDIAAGPQKAPAAERDATPAAVADPAADAAGAELNDTAQQAIDQAMTRLPGAAVAGSGTPAPPTDAGVDQAQPAVVAADLDAAAVTGADAPQPVEAGRTPSAPNDNPTPTVSNAAAPTDPAPTDPAPATPVATTLRPAERPGDASALRTGAPADIVRAIDPAPGATAGAAAGTTTRADQAAEPTQTIVENPEPAGAAADAGGPGAGSDAGSDASSNAAPDAAAAPAVAGGTGSAVVAVPDLRRLADPEHAQFSETSPAVYDARFTTTRGAFTLRVRRAWAPRAADRFYQLCRAGFYNNNRFFRVVPGFVVQWGIHGFPSVATAWRNTAIDDEPVRERNRRGTVSFAAAAVPNTRTTQVFINLSDNAFLDDLGFAPFAEVTQGMGVVEQLFSGYGEAPSQLQRRIQLDGNAFLDANYPDLDGVVEVEIDEAPLK